MIQFIIHWMPLLDAAAKIVAIVGVLGLGFAFCQYRHSVRIAERNEKRASVELASKECLNFGGALLPQLLKLREEIENSGCQFFNHFKFVREEKNLHPDASAVTDEDYNGLNKYLPETVRLLNMLEGFAIPFVAGVADDRVGFVECSRSFVDLFEKFFGLYARHDLKNFYPSTQSLYWRWRKQIVQDERRRMHLEAGSKFFSLTESIIREESQSKAARAAASLMRWAADRLSNQGK